MVEGDTSGSTAPSASSARREFVAPSAPWVEEMIRDVTALGSYAFIIILLVAAVGYLLLIRKYGLAALLLAAELGGMLLSNLLKAGFDRPRPDLEHAARVFTTSFPSGQQRVGGTFRRSGAR